MIASGPGAVASSLRRRVAAAVALSAVAAGAWLIAGRSRPDAEGIRRSAEADLEAGRPERAEAALARIAGPEPRDWLLRARALKARNRPVEALAALARVDPKDPLAPRAFLLAGQIELRRDRLRAAEEAFRAALGRDPSLVQAHRELIYIEGMQLRRRELADQFQALARETPMTFENVYHWCLTRNVVWEPHEHAGHLRRFVEADPADRWSRVALAESLRQLGRLGEAMQLLVDLPDSDPEARAVRARVALDRGDDREARSLLDGGPVDHPELALLRGRFALAHHDAPAALRHFRAAHDAEPDNRDAVFGLAVALTSIGDPASAAPFRKASKAFDTLGGLVARAAIPGHRNDPSLMRDLGAACEAVGRFSEAYAWYRLCIQRDPLDRESQGAVDRLRPYAPRRR